MIVGGVFVERFDEPVTPGPDGASFISGVTDGVGVACDIEPHGGPVFAVCVAGEVFGDGVLVGLFGGVGGKFFDFGDGGGESGEVEGEAT